MASYKAFLQTIKAVLIAFALLIVAPMAKADIDGHGPDAWRVTGVPSHEKLNARMGPGTNYPIIEAFSHNERAMQQITCVPFYTAAHYTALTEKQIKALPPRWCLMRTASMSKAGWVAQRFITPDGTVELSAATSADETPPGDVDPVAYAQELVREVYETYDLAQSNGQRDPLERPYSANYFTADVVDFLSSDQVQAHPLYGGQDFDVVMSEPKADPDQPMLRGMITINVDYTNFGQAQRAVFYLRADTSQPGAPIRIFRVEHDGWSYP